MREVTRSESVVPGQIHSTRDVALAIAGDTGAFERLFHAYAPRMHTVAVRFVGPDAADDALQDIFIRAWDRLPQFRGDADFGTWLHRLGINVLVRQSARARRHDTKLLNGSESIQESQPGIDTRLDLDNALLRLSPDIRAVVVLHDIEGFSHDEIASSIGISASASRMRLHRARLQLREWLLR